MGVIDLGTNSIRSGIYEIPAYLELNRIYRFKKMIRLGDGVYKNSKLDPAAYQRCLEAFDEIYREMQNFKVNKIIAFATSALRNANDRKSLIKEVFQKTNIKIQIISGFKEAKLIAKGILHNQPTPNTYFALVDIGGGSTEISICNKMSVIDSYSFHLGANRLQQLFLKTTPPEVKPNHNPITKLRKHIREEIYSASKEREWPRVKIILGSSGTIKAFKRIFRSKQRSIEPYKLDDLKELNKSMIPMNQEQLQAIEGMDPKRIDLILAGGILLEEICHCLGAKDVYTSKYNLRDGILEEELEKLYFT